jgi:hypothetical protein
MQTVTSGEGEFAGDGGWLGDAPLPRAMQHPLRPSTCVTLGDVLPEAHDSAAAPIPAIAPAHRIGSAGGIERHGHHTERIAVESGLSQPTGLPTGGGGAETSYRCGQCWLEVVEVRGHTHSHTHTHTHTHTPCVGRWVAIGVTCSLDGVDGAHNRTALQASSPFSARTAISAVEPITGAMRSRSG